MDPNTHECNLTEHPQRKGTNMTRSVLNSYRLHRLPGSVSLTSLDIAPSGVALWDSSPRRYSRTDTVTAVPTQSFQQQDFLYTSSCWFHSDSSDRSPSHPLIWHQQVDGWNTHSTSSDHLYTENMSLASLNKLRSKGSQWGDLPTCIL